MTKNEFLSELTKALTKNKISDSNDIINEYEQHFTFKMSDGFSQEEIAARLGDPESLAAQFVNGANKQKYTGRKAVAVLGLSFADLFVGITFILLIAWGIVMVAATLSFAALAFCLILKTNIYSLIPPMPYLPSLIFGISSIALALLTAVGSIYFISFIRQLMRAYRRFHFNVIAAASDRAVLPSVAIHPQLSLKAIRRIRAVALACLAVFAVTLVLGVIISMISAVSLEFWHSWGWFGYISK